MWVAQGVPRVGVGVSGRGGPKGRTPSHSDGWGNVSGLFRTLAMARLPRTTDFTILGYDIVAPKNSFLF